MKTEMSADYDPFMVSDDEVASYADDGEFDQAKYHDLLKTWARDEGKTISKRAKTKTLFDQGVKQTEKERSNYTKMRLKSLKEAFETTKVDLKDLQAEQKDVKARVKKITHISSLNPEKWTKQMRRFINEQDGKLVNLSV